MDDRLIRLNTPRTLITKLIEQNKLKSNFIKSDNVHYVNLINLIHTTAGQTGTRQQADNQGTRNDQRHANAHTHGKQKHTRTRTQNRPRRAGTPYIAVQCISKTREVPSDFGRGKLKKGIVFLEGKVHEDKKAIKIWEIKKEKRGLSYNVNWSDILGVGKKKKEGPEVRIAL